MTTRYNCPQCDDSVLSLDEETQVHSCPDCELELTADAAELQFESGDLVVASADETDEVENLDEETEFNGFSNRTTWAANLLINNNYKLYRESRAFVGEDEGKALSALKAFVETSSDFADLETDEIEYSEILEELKDAGEETKAIAEELETALAGSEGLSDEAKAEIVQVFESALQVAVNRLRLRVEEETAERFDIELAEAVTELNTQADAYLTSIAEEWFTENQIAIESGIKVEKTEQFIEGLHQLFAENFIKVPEERFDVLADLAAKVESLEEAVATAKAETKAAEAKLVNENKKGITAKLAEGLADSDVERLGELAESIDYESDQQFQTALSKLKESLIDSKNAKKGAVSLTEEGDEIDDDDEESKKASHNKIDDPVIAAAANMLRQR